MLASCGSVPTLSMMMPLVPPSSPREPERVMMILPPVVTLADITQPVPGQFVGTIKGPMPLVGRSPDCTLKNMKSVPAPTLGLKISVTGEHWPAAPVVLPTVRRTLGLALVAVPSALNAMRRSVGTSVDPFPQTHIKPAILPGELLK